MTQPNKKQRKHRNPSDAAKSQYAKAARKHYKDAERANTPAKIDQSGGRYGKSVKKKVYRTL